MRKLKKSGRIRYPLPQWPDAFVKKKKKNEHSFWFFLAIFSRSRFGKNLLPTGGGVIIYIFVVVKKKKEKRLELTWTPESERGEVYNAFIIQMAIANPSSELKEDEDEDEDDDDEDLLEYRVVFSGRGLHYIVPNLLPGFKKKKKIN